jgi:hypothetical protein
MDTVLDVTIPPGLVRDVREGALALLAEAAEDVRRLATDPARGYSAGEFARLLRTFERAVVLLDLIGWQFAPEVAVEVDSAELRITLAEALRRRRAVVASDCAVLRQHRAGNEAECAEQGLALLDEFAAVVRGAL